MGRGKIEHKMIENRTNRQVTYSKRRNGIFKKAQELTVLCDAKVSIIMISNTKKFHEFVSPSTSTKKILDEYQSTLGIDLWSTHYEKMQDNLKKLKEINMKLRREIRMGEDLDDLSLAELVNLESTMTSAAAALRDRKMHVIKTQTNTCNKKVNSLRQRNGNFLHTFEAIKCEDPHYGLIDDGDYESVAIANGAANLYAFRLDQAHHDLHHGGFGLHDLRLA